MLLSCFGWQQNDQVFCVVCGLSCKIAGVWPSASPVSSPWSHILMKPFKAATLTYTQTKVCLSAEKIAQHFLQKILRRWRHPLKRLRLHTAILELVHIVTSSLDQETLVQSSLFQRHNAPGERGWQRRQYDESRFGDVGIIVIQQQ